jgi:hypothetical protein
MNKQKLEMLKWQLFKIEHKYELFSNLNYKRYKMGEWALAITKTKTISFIQRRKIKNKYKKDIRYFKTQSNRHKALSQSKIYKIYQEIYKQVLDNSH